MPDSAAVQIEDGSALTQQAWNLLASRLPGGKPVRRVLDFRDEADRTPTPLADRMAILEQAALIFANFYPHLPFKQQLYPFAHPERLLDTAREQIAQLSETEFHSHVIDVFSHVRDAHTHYGTPPPYRQAVAFLPFVMRTFTNGRLIVTNVMSVGPGIDGFGHPFFTSGAEIVFMSQLSVEAHILRTAASLPAGDPAAVQRRGALACTIRPLQLLEFPFADELPAATVYYRPAGGGDLRAIRLPWGVVEWPGGITSFPSGTFSVSSFSHAMTACADLLHGKGWNNHAAAPSAPVATDFRQVSHLPGVFDFTFTSGPRQSGPIDLHYLATPEFPNARFGYIAIRSFSAETTAELVAEFQRILQLMDAEAPDGLVLDLRANPGGDIVAAEQMLQMLTSARIQPAGFALANTPAMLEVLARSQPAGTAHITFEAWLGDAAGTPFPSGEPLTSTHPVTNVGDANAIGQVYQGPVALLVDALTYSAADIFAGGFQDHAIGPVIGPDYSTGGGGANVWTHDDLVSIVGPLTPVPLEKLPGDVMMSLAIRRSARVGPHAGAPIEDIGVKVDIQHNAESIQDLLDGIPSIIRRACLALGRIQTSRVDVSAVVVLDGGAMDVTIARTAHVDELRFFVDGRLELTQPVATDAGGRFHVPAIPGLDTPSVLRVEGCIRRKDASGAESAVAAAVRQIALQQPDSSDEPDDSDPSSQPE